MVADFHDAHIRHLTDAEQLHSASRLASADHLYGLAAECGLKRLMLCFGMIARSDGSPDLFQDRKHANELWPRYEAYRSGSQAGTRYALPLSDPFADWAIEQRYAAQINFDSARVINHQVGAQLVKQLIENARLDGLL